MTIRILLVDDQELVRQGLRFMLKPVSDFAVVGEADHGKSALTQIPLLKPDVVLMDIRMPIMDGVAATKQIRQQFPEIKVLVLTTFDDDEYVSRAIHYGASGYLLKDTPIAELTQTIQAVHRGYLQLGPGLAAKLNVQAKPISPPGWTELTEREQEIATLIAQGKNNREISETLFLAEKTVKNYVTKVLSQLGVRDRTQAALIVQQWINPAK
ncbi:response regulator transcription factor [filamentous cyanobacterium LEGE 11480]|uniref:Response regulator transcription factor n=1 Tax=Romeriopsis navalis LEGE 11480 TaxID=2777977 RepID=A0A928Z394_9CYAN|nr:response regulator transcription factor [Romeriopsis navalis]MBE9029090.1 response regulator transcription factor [Romeriopsis navalis LEGE 11480]